MGTDRASKSTSTTGMPRIFATCTATQVKGKCNGSLPFFNIYVTILIMHSQDNGSNFLMQRLHDGMMRDARIAFVCPSYENL